MNKRLFDVSSWSVGSKITVFTFALVGLILAALVTVISWTTSSILQGRAEVNVKAELRSVMATVEMFDKAVSSEATAFGRIFAAGLPGGFSLDTANPIAVGGKQVPALLQKGKPLNLDFSAPDEFTRTTGGNATIFVASGEDFVRISTSVRKENGERAVGTMLDHASPAYAKVRAGKPYVGLITLFGKQTITDYEPVLDASGKVIAVLYVGVDISADLAVLKQRIKSMKVGDSGYIYVLNAAPGKNLGEVLVHPTREGQNMLASRDAAGRDYVREMLAAKEGLTTYTVQNADDAAPRKRLVAYTLFEDWNWLIAGGTYEDEIVQEAARLRNHAILSGLVALAIFAAILHAVIKRTVTRPLGEARDAAVRMAQGDLSVALASSRRDEIGRLAAAMDEIGKGLSNVVGRVRGGAEQIASASSEISSGNLDLCARTEQQAATLAATASSMQDLTETVRQNAGDAHQANQLAVNTSMVAEEGGRMVGQVIERMEAIRQSSGRIKDIIGVIDGIAFQTNILALNAAVEAARAGEQGRGFAVVASEVRNLAQRSAAAAKEIKALIEASGAEVDAGSRLVQEAGATMSEVLGSAGQVTAIMGRISAASTEQTGDIENINRAIGEMDQATQHNAALVEQASAAAQAMQEQADELARAVRLFKLDGAQAAAAAGRPALVSY
ncbi:chemotaxis protein [Massilia sp. WF1]|uniref:methyl-accepting chemotaxis protein n=1 Tax=unclassified Massilia TaxID=2609279 RepID=UPI00064A2697|nr:MULTISPECIES: methyl-accepting chemotaxis protein [unclassified Massilia]ALK97148.1 chemotaxis protein [Massilia sp. WG5]KLU35878.1 chemotaxis protein [Massilia sp. WF1]